MNKLRLSTNQILNSIYMEIFENDLNFASMVNYLIDSSLEKSGIEPIYKDELTKRYFLRIILNALETTLNNNLTKNLGRDETLYDFFEKKCIYLNEPLLRGWEDDSIAEVSSCLFPNRRDCLMLDIADMVLENHLFVKTIKMIKSKVGHSEFSLWRVEKVDVNGGVVVYMEGDYRILEWENDHYKDGKYVK